MKRLLLATLILFPGCRTLGAATSVRVAQIRLGAAKPNIELLVAQFNARAERRLEQCMGLNLETVAQRKSCMGVYDPTSNYSLSLYAMQEAYNRSAARLHDLAVALEAIEAHHAREDSSE